MPYADPEQRRAFARRNYAAHREELIAYQATYRAANPEKVAARAKRWRAANQDRLVAVSAAYYIANKERMNTAGAAYYAAHREIMRAQNAEWRAANRDKVLADGAAYRVANASPEKNVTHNLRYKYGLTVEERATMAAQQGGVCVLCGKAEGTGRAGKLHVDHCHECEGIDLRGSIRGLLCGPCNRGLKAASFDPAWLLRALDYAERHVAICPARNRRAA